MARKRKVYAPFSLTSEAGVGQTPVEGYIDVDQQIYPTVATGTVNENGKWVGVKSSDDEFIGLSKFLAIAGGGTVLAPDTVEFPVIDMTGFRSIFIAIKPTAAGNYAISAVMGPDTIPFANLSPVDAAARIRGNGAWSGTNTAVGDVIVDGVESLTADVWNIFPLQDKLVDQKSMQFLITNNTGNPSDIEFGFMRLL